ncbi:hypothetical protein KAU11_04830 [Candidatus Babeliales bacterium]|nr:hypothetical protein [Candidatus Babeliales bacterium]
MSIKLKWFFKGFLILSLFCTAPFLGALESGNSGHHPNGMSPFGYYHQQSQQEVQAKVFSEIFKNMNTANQLQEDINELDAKLNTLAKYNRDTKKWKCLGKGSFEEYQKKLYKENLEKDIASVKAEQDAFLLRMSTTKKDEVNNPEEGKKVFEEKLASLKGKITNIDTVDSEELQRVCGNIAGETVVAQLAEQRESKAAALNVISKFQKKFLDEIDPDQDWRRAIASGISDGKQTTIKGAILQKMATPVGKHIEKASESFFNRLFYRLGDCFGTVLCWLHLKSAISVRKTEQIAEGVNSLITALHNVQRQIDTVGGQSRAMNMRDVTRILPDEAQGAADVGSEKTQQVEALKFVLKENICMQIDELVEVVEGNFLLCRKGETLAKSCLNRIRHGLESIKEIVSKTTNINELVSGEVLPQLSVLTDFVKSACEALKRHVDPSFGDSKSASSSSTSFSGYSGYGHGGIGGAYGGAYGG